MLRHLKRTQLVTKLKILCKKMFGVMLCFMPGISRTMSSSRESYVANEALLNHL
jgi:hypothetical protein